MERQVTVEPKQTLLTLLGEQGAIQVTIWEYDGSPLGVLGIHSRTPLQPQQEMRDCVLLGQCYSDVAFAGGWTVAGLWVTGQHEEAWAEIEDWYGSRFPLEEEGPVEQPSPG